MLTVKIDEDKAIDMLIDRVEFWTDDADVITLYAYYCTDMVFEGVYDGMEFDVPAIVDNDYINWLSVYSVEDAESEDWITDDRIVARYKDLLLVNAI